MTHANDACEDITKELESLLVESRDCGQAEREDRIKTWLHSLPDEKTKFGFRLICIYRERDATLPRTGTFVQGDMYVTDKSTHTNTGGGDIVGSAVGAGAIVNAQYIENCKNRIDASTNIEENIRDSFNAAVDEICEQEWGDDEKSEVLSDLDKLRELIPTSDPKPSLIKKFWGGITSIAGALPSIIELGKNLADKFPGIIS